MKGRETCIIVDDEGLFDVNDLKIIEARFGTLDVGVQSRPLRLNAANGINVVFALRLGQSTP